MLSAILSSFIKLPFVFKIFILFIFDWPLKTGLIVFPILNISPGYYSKTEIEERSDSVVDCLT